MRASLGRARWLGAWAVATGLLWLAFRSVDWRGVVEAWGGAVKPWLGVALVLNFSILLAWAAQWRLFVPRLTERSTPGGPDGPAGARPSFGRIFEVVSVMSTVANSIPFMAGQAVGLHLLATRARTGHAVALSVLALDQLAEGMAKVALLVVLAALVPLPPGLRRAALVVAAGVALLAVALVVAARLERRGRLDPVGGGAVRRFVHAFAAGLQALRSPGTVVGGLLLALAMKAAEGGAILAAQRALGVDLPPWVTLLVLASVALATMVAVAPANLGVYEAAAFAAYRLAGVAPETAAALAIVHHALFLLPAAGTGWLVVAWRGRSLPRGAGGEAESAARLRPLPGESG